ncbi:MAG: hypothetical protein WBZ36_22055, partial [Candidatus Nitrosopolaris sp.]
ESLIERGRVLIDVSFLKSSNKEIKKMNIGKVGAPFQYSDSYVLGHLKKISGNSLLRFLFLKLLIHVRKSH